jgi:hypothetical protein
MSLQIFETLEQGSPEWIAARCGVLTASVIGKLISPKLQVANNETSRGVIETLVAERITGDVDLIQPTKDMERGTNDEPYARAEYSEQYAPVTEIGFALRDLGGLKLGASPDGLVSWSGGIEIKSRKPKIQVRAFITNEVPAENMRKSRRACWC